MSLPGLGAALQLQTSFPRSSFQSPQNFEDPSVLWIRRPHPHPHPILALQDTTGGGTQEGGLPNNTPFWGQLQTLIFGEH